MTDESKYYILIHGLYLGFANIFIFDGPLFSILTNPDELAKPLTTTVMFAGSLLVFLLALFLKLKADLFRILLPVSVVATFIFFIFFIVFGYYLYTPANIIIIPLLEFLIAAAAMLYMISTITCLVRLIPLGSIHISIVLITLLTYLVVYLTDLFVANGFINFALFFAMFILALALALSIRIRNFYYDDIVFYKTAFNFRALGLLVVATFLLNLSTCGISIPAFKSFMFAQSERIVYFYMLPLLLVAVLLIRRSGTLQKSMDIVLTLAAAAYALSFVLFIYSQKNIFLTNSLLQSAYPVVDVILWTLAIQMIHIYGRSYRIAALMTFAVVFSAYLGVTGGELLIGRVEEPHITLSFVSLIGAILAIMIIPVLTRLVKSPVDLLYRDYTLYCEKKKTILRLNLLTEREMEIVNYLTEDLLNKEIAAKLRISENTIKTHARNIYTKLNIKNKKELKSLLDGATSESFSKTHRSSLDREEES